MRLLRIFSIGAKKYSQKIAPSKELSPALAIPISMW